MTSHLEQYKERLRRMDALQRQHAGSEEDSSEHEELCEQCEAPWYGMTAEEQQEASRYSAELYGQWSPRERYLDAVAMLKQMEGRPHLNEVTPAERIAEIVRHWESVRDKAKAEMDAIAV